MKGTEIRATILGTLYKVYQEHGFKKGSPLADLAAELAGVDDSVQHARLHDLANERLIEIARGARGRIYRLTTKGVDAIENDPSEALALQFVQHNNFSGAQMQNVQVGSNNTINASYGTVLTELQRAIEASDVPDEQKRVWLKSIGEICQHPLAQTAINLANIAATVAAG